MSENSGGGQWVRNRVGKRASQEELKSQHSLLLIKQTLAEVLFLDWVNYVCFLTSNPNRTLCYYYILSFADDDELGKWKED